VIAKGAIAALPTGAITKDMTPEQITEALRLARGWNP